MFGEKSRIAQLPLHRRVHEGRTKEFDVRIVAGTGLTHRVRIEFAIFGASEAHKCVDGAWLGAAVRNEDRCLRLHDAEGNGRPILDRFARTKYTENRVEIAVDNGETRGSQRCGRARCDCKNASRICNILSPILNRCYFCCR